MKDTHRYVIETANLDSALKEFAQMNQGISINRTDNDNEIRLDITDGSRKGILHLYHKNGGNYIFLYRTGERDSRQTLPNLRED